MAATPTDSSSKLKCIRSVGTADINLFALEMLALLRRDFCLCLFSLGYASLVESGQINFNFRDVFGINNDLYVCAVSDRFSDKAVVDLIQINAICLQSYVFWNRNCCACMGCGSIISIYESVTYSIHFIDQVKFVSVKIICCAKFLSCKVRFGHKYIILILSAMLGAWTRLIAVFRLQSWTNWSYWAEIPFATSRKSLISAVEENEIEYEHDDYHFDWHHCLTFQLYMIFHLPLWWSFILPCVVHNIASIQRRMKAKTKAILSYYYTAWII